MTVMLRVDTQLRLIGQMLATQTMDVQSFDLQSATTAFNGMKAYLDNLVVKFLPCR